MAVREPKKYRAANKRPRKVPRHMLLWRPLLAVLFGVSLAGCLGSNGGRQEVTGEITFDGQPLEGGWIYFRPVDKGPSAAGQIRDGRFEIPGQKGLPPGTYRVAIEYQRPTGRMRKVYTGEQIEEMQQVIPPRYNQQTELTAEVQASGSNHFSFDLSSD